VGESPDPEPPDAEPSDAEPPDAEPPEGDADGAASEPEPEPEPEPEGFAEAAAFEVPAVPVSERADPWAESEAGTGGGTGADAAASFDAFPWSAAEKPGLAGSGAGTEEALSLLRGSSSEPRRLTATPLEISTTRADANASPTKAPRRCCSAKKVLPQTPQPGRPGERNSRPSAR
jgi:hypothetical protein